MNHDKYDIIRRMPMATTEDFYQIVRILNSECGKGNWEMRPRKVLKEFKSKEKYNISMPVVRDIYVPKENQTAIAMLELLK